MSASDAPLCLSEHRIVAARWSDGSVTRWRCLDCHLEFGCASSYVESACGRGVEQS